MQAPHRDSDDRAFATTYLIEFNLDGAVRKNRLFFIDKVAVGSTVGQLYKYLHEREPAIDLRSVRLAMRVAIKFGHCTLTWSREDKTWFRVRPDGTPSGQMPLRLRRPSQ
ncbi:hypothetical protein [Rhizobium sp. WYJ-E13]|uniref:hypothetical protein n=1 Tax=Rhizobium sp. WYJ-E13 TaxID=2849093 RepID=UPI001C1EA700|nr:hypothetical protein [Rhizobium sp. WYJ-E13]QWW72450.1 hypothetical protein KQ933_31485 [Rhizobium sp. WYJ-E13]